MFFSVAVDNNAVAVGKACSAQILRGGKKPAFHSKDHGKDILKEYEIGQSNSYYSQD